LLSSTDAVLTLGHPGADGPAPDVLRLHLLGSDPAAAVTGEGLLPSHSSYFLGNDPGRWQANVPNYAAAVVHAYPGIDLAWPAGPQRGVAHASRPAAGASPAWTRSRVAGARAARLDDGGNLVLTTASGAQLSERAPTLART